MLYENMVEFGKNKGSYSSFQSGIYEPHPSVTVRCRPLKTLLSLSKGVISFAEDDIHIKKLTAKFRPRSLRRYPMQESQESPESSAVTVINGLP